MPFASPSSAYNPARALAIRVLLQVRQAQAFAAPTLDAALQEAKLPARDAGLATHLVYGTLRHIRSLEASLQPLLKGPTPPKAQTLLLVALFEKFYLRTPLHAVTNEYVNLAKHARWAAPALVNAVVRRAQHVQLASELPDWLTERYQQVFGEQAQAVLADLLTPQPLWLYCSDAGKQQLLEQGHAIGATVQGVSQVELATPLRETKAYQHGEAQPMNPASLSCVVALGEVRGQQVLDLAGGAGIKAAILAARGAQVTSVDIAAHKHKAGQRNLERLNWQDEGASVQFVTQDLTALKQQDQQLQPAPKVLLDAPCSGSGTLRAHPEIALRLTPQDVTALAELQAAMLSQAAALVQAGGLLVYSVCSVLREEGVEVVQRFLAQHSEFAPLPFEGLSEGLECPALAQAIGHLTLPLGGIDGFYIARLQKA